MNKKNDNRIRECFTCWRWATKRPGDYVCGRCGKTGCETPARFGCDWWIDHPGEISLAEQMERKRLAAEAEARRREEEAVRLMREAREQAREHLSEATCRRALACWNRAQSLIKDHNQRIAYVSARTGLKMETVQMIVGQTSNNI